MSSYNRHPVICPRIRPSRDTSTLTRARKQDPHIFATDTNIFYSDLDPATQQHWASKLKSHALATFWAKTTAASWQEMPTSYLLCEDDLVIPAVAQEQMCQAVKESGADIEVTRLKSGHSPFLSRPKETVAWLRRVAGETI